MAKGLDYQGYRDRLTLLFQRYGVKAVGREARRMLGEHDAAEKDAMSGIALEALDLVDGVVRQLEAQRDAVTELCSEYADEIVRLGGKIPTPKPVEWEEKP